MKVKTKGIDEMIEKRQKEFELTTKERSDDVFILKENLDIEVIDHGNTYTDPVEVKYAVRCPECGKIVYLEDGDCNTEKSEKIHR